MVNLNSDTSVFEYQKSPNIESSSNRSIKTKIKINLAFVKNIEEIEPKVEGIGLLRLEHGAHDRSIWPTSCQTIERQQTR